MEMECCLRFAFFDVVEGTHDREEGMGHSQKDVLIVGDSEIESENRGFAVGQWAC